MRVFISYAHSDHDSPLARWLAGTLRAGGVEVWLDEDETAPGAPLEQTIRGAVDASDAAVFLISQSWHERKFTNWELQQFALRRPPCERLVPVLRGRRTELERLIPPHLTQLTYLEWPPDEADPLPRFWQLYCGLTGRRPGPRDTWARQAQTVVSAPPPPPAPPPRAAWDAAARQVHPGQDWVSLRCNRSKQWGLLDTHAQDARHEILLLPGPRGYGHDHFLTRVERELRRDPPRLVLVLQWTSRPRSEAAYLAELARHLDLDPGAAGDLRVRVAARLDERLKHQNLVLLYPAVCAGFTDEQIDLHFTRTLPDLLGRVQAPHSLKCLLPLQWQVSPALQRLGAKLARALWRESVAADWIEQACDEDDATGLITRLRAGAGPRLSVSVLPPLLEVPDDEILEFLERLRLPEPQQRKLLSRIRSGRPTPEALFKAIDTYYPEFSARPDYEQLASVSR